MTLPEAVKLATFIVVAAMMAALIKIILDVRKSPLSIRKRAIVCDTQEYLSVWEIAHQWEDMDSAQTDRENVPAEIKRRINRVLQAYFRKELPLRKPDSYRLTGHHWLHAILCIDNQHEKLSADLDNDELDIRLIDCLYVRRGEILRWCEKEFTEPPSCWALPSSKPQVELSVVDDDNRDDWYSKLTQPRREKTACLEVAKFLWEQNPNLLYEEVRTHPVMTQAGLRNVFTADTFKTWARDFAPEEARKGGRRAQSNP